MMKASSQNAISRKRLIASQMLTPRNLHLSSRLRMIVMAAMRPGTQMNALVIIQVVSVNPMSTFILNV